MEDSYSRPHQNGVRRSGCRIKKVSRCGTGFATRPVRTIQGSEPMASNEIDEYCEWLRRRLKNLAQSVSRASATHRLMLAVLVELIGRELELNCKDEPPGR